MKKILYLILLLLSFNNLNSQEIIEMEKINNIFHIPCKVNGIPMKLIFDTGASDVSISLIEAKFLIKQGLIKKEDFLGDVDYKIADGTIIQGKKFIIKTIEIGSRKLNNIEATIMPNQDAPLLLGQSAISKLGNYTISGNNLIINDYSNSKTNKMEIDDLQGYYYLKFGKRVNEFENIKIAKQLNDYNIYELTKFEEKINNIANVNFSYINLTFDKTLNQLKIITFIKEYKTEYNENNQYPQIEELKILNSVFQSLYGKSKLTMGDNKMDIKQLWEGSKKFIEIELKLVEVGVSEIGLPTQKWHLFLTLSNL